MAHHARNKDGGWGWVIVSATFAALFIRVATIKVFSVLLPSIQDDMQLDTWVIGWMISAMLTISDFTALPAAWLCSRAGHRLIVMTGGVMVGTGIISCSLSAGLQQLLVSIIVTGIGMGLVENPTVVMISDYFETKYGTANSLALTAVPIGIMVAPPMAQLSLETYGWRATLLLWGGLAFHIVVCGAMLRPVRAANDPQDKQLRPYQQTPPAESPGEHPVKSYVPQVPWWRKFLDSAYFVKNYSFATVVFLLCCERLCFMSWVIYLVPYAVRAGIRPHWAAWLASGAGFGNLFGKIVQGVFVDSQLIGPNVLLCITAVTAGLSLMLDPLFTNSYPGMLALCVLYGVSVGTLYPLGVTVLRDLVGEKNLIHALGSFNVALGVMRMPMGFFPGWLYDTSGSYDTSFVVLGAVELLPVPFLLVDMLRRSRWWPCPTHPQRVDYETLDERTAIPSAE